MYLLFSYTLFCFSLCPSKIWSSRMTLESQTVNVRWKIAICKIRFIILAFPRTWWSICIAKHQSHKLILGIRKLSSKRLVIACIKVILHYNVPFFICFYNILLYYLYINSPIGAIYFYYFRSDNSGIICLPRFFPLGLLEKISKNYRNFLYPSTWTPHICFVYNKLPSILFLMKYLAK